MPNIFLRRENLSLLAENRRNIVDIKFEYDTLNPDSPVHKKITILKEIDFLCEFDIVKNIWKKRNYKGGIIVNYKVRCPSCGRRKNVSQMANVTDVKYVLLCIKCTEGSGRYTKCPRCNGYFNNHCTCMHQKNRAEMLRYNAKVTAKYYKHSPADKILFGIELEVELNTAYLKDLKEVDKYEWLYYKHDGSMNNGVEIVTHPLGWNWIKHNKEQFDPIFQLPKLGITSRTNGTCGMHVHLPKNIFTSLHLYKFMKFFHDNADYITYIGERTYDDMQRWSYFDKSDYKQLRKFSINKYGNERHSAINLANPETVEVRVFKGTLSKVSFFKNIEFTKAVYDYTKDIKLQNVGSCDLEFENFIYFNAKEYPNLIKFINIKKR